jgi:hypothetical protein
MRVAFLALLLCDSVVSFFSPTLTLKREVAAGLSGFNRETMRRSFDIDSADMEPSRRSSRAVLERIDSLVRAAPVHLV